MCLTKDKIYLASRRPSLRVCLTRDQKYCDGAGAGEAAVTAGLVFSSFAFSDVRLFASTVGSCNSTSLSVCIMTVCCRRNEARRTYSWGAKNSLHRHQKISRSPVSAQQVLLSLLKSQQGLSVRVVATFVKTPSQNLTVLCHPAIPAKNVVLQPLLTMQNYYRLLVALCIMCHSLTPAIA